MLSRRENPRKRGSKDSLSMQRHEKVREALRNVVAPSVSIETIGASVTDDIRVIPTPTALAHMAHVVMSGAQPSNVIPIPGGGSAGTHNQVTIEK